MEGASAGSIIHVLAYIFALRHKLQRHEGWGLGPVSQDGCFGPPTFNAVTLVFTQGYRGIYI